MNSRLTIQDLAALLSESTGKDKESMERFLKVLVAAVSEGVVNDRLMKVKGLGTFKIIPVEKRESIDVNTGARFLIPAHYKFSFLPDKELRELVNRPFAFFETTEINDNVDFSDMTLSKDSDTENNDEEDEAETEASEEEVMPEKEPIVEEKIAEEAKPAPVAETESVAEEKPAVEEKPAEEEKPIIAAAPVIAEKIAEEAKPAPIAETESVAEEKPAIEEKPAEEAKPIIEAAPLDEAKSSAEAKLIVSESKPTASSKSCKRIVYDNGQNEQSNKWKILCIILSAVIVLMVVAFAYLNSDTMLKRTHKHLFMTESSVANKPAPTTMPADTAQTALQKTDTTSLNANQDATTPGTSNAGSATTSSATTTSVTPSSAKTEPAKATATESNTKPDVIAKVKIEPGIRLTLISLKYYGSKIFWVYLYEYNKERIKDPNNIPIGVVIKVPDPSVYGIDKSDAASVRKASDKQSEILSKK